MFTPIILGIVGVPHETLPPDVLGGRCDKVGATFGRPAPNKIWEGKNVQNVARFLTKHLRGCWPSNFWIRFRFTKAC